MFLTLLQKFPDTLSYMKFLSLLWTQHANNFAEELELSAVQQARSLKLGLATARSLQVEDIKIVLDSVSGKHLKIELSILKIELFILTIGLSSLQMIFLLRYPLILNVLHKNASENVLC